MHMCAHTGQRRQWDGGRVAGNAGNVKELGTVKALTAHKCQGSGQVAEECSLNKKRTNPERPDC